MMLVRCDQVLALMQYLDCTVSMICVHTAKRVQSGGTLRQDGINSVKTLIHARGSSYNSYNSYHRTHMLGPAGHNLPLLLLTV